MNVKIKSFVKENKVHSINIRLYNDDDKYLGICNVAIPVKNARLLGAARAYGEDFQTAAMEFMEYPLEDQFTKDGVFSTDDVVYIDLVEVVYDERGKGYGYDLLDVVITLFCGSPDTSLILVVNQHSRFDLVKWYETFGFHKLNNMCMRYSCAT